MIPLALVAAIVYLPFIVIYLVLRFMAACLVVIAISASWLPQGKRFLVIFSESKFWSAYFHDEVLPNFEGRAEVINLSRDGGKKTKWNFSWLIHKHFTGTRNRFPIVIRFSTLSPWSTVRFYNAFKEAKKGNIEQLESAKIKLTKWYPNNA
jgi:hypothetical protein